MAITFRDCQKGGAGTANATVTKPTGTVDNDLLVAQVGSSGGVTGAPAGWTKVRETNPTSTIRFATWWKVASGEGASFVFTGTGVTAAIVACFAGCLTSSPQDVEGGASNASSTACCAPSITTTQSGDLLVFGGSTNLNSQTFTPPSGMTEPTNGEETTVHIELAYLLNAGDKGATGDQTATLSGATTNVGHLVSFKAIPLSPPFQMRPNRNTLLRR